MKKSLLIILLTISVLTGVSYGYKLERVRKISKSGMKNILGDKIFILDDFSLVRDKGTLFMMVRDNKTRNLEWVIVNPFTNSKVKGGTCPFKAFTLVDVSPKGEGAIVYARYPTSVWYLNTDNKKWKMIYKNPGKGQTGLAVLSISPICFIEKFRAFSIMDMWDSEHFVVGTFITSFIPKSTKKVLQKIITLKNLTTASVKKVFGSVPSDRAFKADFLRFSAGKSFAYTLKSRLRKKRTDYKDYLFSFHPPNKVNLLDKADGRILPLDYISKPEKVLYSLSAGGKTIVYFRNSDKKSQVMEGKGIVGKIMKNNILGVCTIKGRSFNIFIGEAGKEMKRVFKKSKMYKVGFINNGKKLILSNPEGIIAYKIIK